MVDSERDAEASAPGTAPESAPDEDHWGRAMEAAQAGDEMAYRALLEELRRRGWVVVKTTPSLSQLVEGFALPPDGDVDALVDDFARRINHNVSERAYALEAALGFLSENMLHITDRPVVAVGCSAGAIALPTVAARLPVRVDAAVLVGGGCDLYRIVTTSDLFRDRLDIQVEGRPITRPELRALRGPILERAHLDPYHTAACLHDVPVLMLHGSYDRIVPAATAIGTRSAVTASPRAPSHRTAQTRRASGPTDTGNRPEGCAGSARRSPPRTGPAGIPVRR